jgi:hypothetical protein
VSVVARVIRQFEAPHELVTLEKVLTLPSVPTIGTRLDLRAHGVETPLTVIGLTFRPENIGRSVALPDAEIVLDFEPLAAAQLAREGGWGTPSRG